MNHLLFRSVVNGARRAANALGMRAPASAASTGGARQQRVVGGQGGAPDVLAFISTFDARYCSQANTQIQGYFSNIGS